MRVSRRSRDERALLPKFSLSLLVRFELTGPEGPVELPNKKLAGLLAYLACTAPMPQPRQKLATLLWGSHSRPRRNRTCAGPRLRQYGTMGHRLRRRSAQAAA
jgi:hypothetical protein